MYRRIRRRYLSAHWYALVFAPLILALPSYLLASYLAKAKPEEKFSIFVSALGYDDETLRGRVNEWKTEEYAGLLDFSLEMQVETSPGFDSYFYVDGLKYSDLVVFPSSLYETAFANVYSNCFAPLDVDALTSQYGKRETVGTGEAEYAVKIHDKGEEAEDKTLGITFGEDDYYVAINKSSVHNSSPSDACTHFLGAFLS